MKTEDLIAALAADTRPRPGVAHRLARALPVALAVTLGAFLLFWGLRSDLAAALASPAVLKPLVPLVPAVLAGVLALTLSRPEARGGFPVAGLWIIGAGLLAGFGAALVGGGLSGLNRALATPSLLTCLTSIPALSLPLLGAALWALSAGAPRRPGVVGWLAGLAAGGAAAAIYAFYCDQDAALFVLPAYGAAIMIVAALGGVVGTRALAW